MTTHTYNLVSNRINVVGCVEGLELVGQQLTHTEEDEAAHTQQVIMILMHHGCNLAILVTVHVHSSEHRQRRQLIVLLILRDVSSAIGRLLR